MAAIASSLQQNFTPEQKFADVIQKDVKKWVDSVVEFKANLDKKKSEPPLEKHLKKIKKSKVNKSSSSGVDSPKVLTPTQRKQVKSRKVVKGNTKSDKAPKKNSFVAIDKFAQIKENYRTFKLPQNWTAGISSGRLVFNRIKVTTFKSQQKISVERSLIITKDCNTHVLINGSEIILTSWALQKVDNIDDVKRAVRDIDSLKICEGPTNGQKSPQCFIFLDNQHKTCPACKSEVTNPQKQEKSVPASKKPKPSKPKTVSKKNSVQKEKSDRTGLISENGLMSK